MRRRWLSASLVVLGALTGLEVGLSVVLARAETVAWSESLLERIRAVYIHEDWEVLQASEQRVRYDPELLYLLRPGPHRFENREFETTVEGNSLGLRDDEASLDAPDLIVLGDSYAMGWGVEVEQSFPQVVESRTGCKVLNAAMSSYGTGRELLLLERLDLSTARAVVVQYFLNDFAENRRFAQAVSPPAAMAMDSFRSWISKLRERSRYRPFDYSRALFGPLDFHPELDQVSKEEIGRVFLEVLSRSEELDSIPTFFIQIDPWADPEHNISATLSDLLAAHAPSSSSNSHLTIIDLAETLEADDYFLLDPHLRARGHRKVAAEIVRALEDAGIWHPEVNPEVRCCV